MLGTRIVTAVILLVLLLAVLLQGGEKGWNLFVLAIMVGAFWEWARLGKLASKQALWYAAIAGLASLLIFNLPGSDPFRYPALALASLFWVAMAPWCLKNSSIGILGGTRLYLSAGFVLIGAAGLALVLIRAQGVVFLLSVIAICFAADIFAYVFGKTLGKRKLAPAISPGKSWEGAIGGAASVLVLSWALIWLADSFPLLRSAWQVVALEHWHPVMLSFWLIVLSAYSVVGDLFESMLKRQAGVKDSSQLLPGHGGILDRIDAQLPVLPLAMLLVSVVTVQGVQ